MFKVNKKHSMFISQIFFATFMIDLILVQNYTLFMKYRNFVPEKRVFLPQMVLFAKFLIHETLLYVKFA